MRRHQASLLCFVAILLSLSGCREDPTTIVDETDPLPSDPADRLAKMYHTRDFEGFRQMMQPGGLGRSGTLFFPHHEAGCQSEPWTSVELLEAHRRMLTPQDITPPEPALPPDFWLTSISVTMTRSTEYTEPTEYYESATNPGGLDPGTYKVAEAMFLVEVLLDLQGDIDYLISGQHRFVFAEDLTMEIDDVRKFTILEWHDLGLVKAAGPVLEPAVSQPAVEPVIWTQLLSLYRLTPPEYFCVSRSPEQLIDNLAQAYRKLRLEQFESLLADGSDSPEYEFILDPASVRGNEKWGSVLERRIHQRMFEPWNTPAGQSPVPAEFWLTSITITLTQSTEFTERTDLYVSPQNPHGLEPKRWKAVDAIYATDVLFDAQGDYDFQVTGRAVFVVLEDLEKYSGQTGKYLLYQWFDLGSQVRTATGAKATWSRIKSLYI